MFDPEKLKQTLVSLRGNAIQLRNRGNAEGLNVQALELLLLQAYTDLAICIDACIELGQRVQTLTAQKTEGQTPENL